MANPSDQSVEDSQRRPDFVRRERPREIIRPGPGQESVWDYPLPPRVESVSQRVRVEFGGIVLADSVRVYRLLQTATPPVYYFPPADVQMGHLLPSGRATTCEWKGVAGYWSVRVGERVAENAAWSYPEPDKGYEVIRGYIAFYARKMDACYVGAYRVTPQPGEYYGGWITPDIVGPFKGEPGTENW
jgi:uncharacterized protein (DUF427 family)